jgi:hypothetical protein
MRGAKSRGIRDTPGKGTSCQTAYDADGNGTGKPACKSNKAPAGLPEHVIHENTSAALCTF